MADESTAKPKKKGGKGKLIMLVAGAVVLAGAGAAGGMFFAGTGHAEEADKKAPAKPAEVRYFEIEKGFTSNLREPDRYVEIGLGVSSRTNPSVGELLKANDVAVRSAVLGLLPEQSADDISTLAGKGRLQATLKAAINTTLKAKAGRAGVDDVYFTNFIVQ